MTSLVWFRHDLRLYDNPALFKAAELGEGVTAVYIHCADWVERHSVAPAQLDFIRRHLHILRTDLEKLNVPLQVVRVKKAKDIASAMKTLAKKNRATHLFFNAEYPLDELQRDLEVNNLLKEEGILVKRCHDRCVVPPGRIRNGQGNPYKVFTAFKKNWLQTVLPVPITPYGKPRKQKATSDSSATAADIDTLFAPHDLRDLSEQWPAGEKVARKRLDLFVEKSIARYQENRDFPAIDGTSMLSPYLAVGALSPRQAIASVLARYHGEWDANPGVQTWISELIWREFYYHVVVDFPEVCKHQPMQAYTNAFPWRDDKAMFEAWCEGKTGIPIVDAAMRQLNATGWMHNRLRMVVAMFLTKNCQIDWRLGEKYFMSQLIDGDFAANNGGWQWSASTGTDAAPYFRIFNPISQGERFDPNGDFVRKWIPELAHLSNRQIHNPPPLNNYPQPIVNLSESRKSTIALFAQLSNHSAT